MIPNLKPELAELIQKISQKNTYYGNKIPDSIMRLFTIVEDDFHCGIEVPFWLSVLQEGRGPRKSSQDHGLIDTIYRWMLKRNMFKSKTKRGRYGEAWVVTRKINKLGNVQFRKHKFIDIYETARKETIKKIEDKFSKEIGKIMIDVL